jgi:molybdate transport system ATP-binding protein
LRSLAIDYRLTAPLALHATFEMRGFTALLGRSGAGKTSLLKALAGLIPATGTPWQGLAPETRPVGYLPQGLALFPHLTILQNAAFALSGPNRLKTAEILLADLGIAHLAHRPAAQVSGGEAQRAALARALGRNPELLLLDEPSAALDAATRDLVVTQLIETIGRRGIPALAATHDANIAALADWIVLLSDGAVIQQGKPREVFNNPATIAAAKLLGYENFWRENGITHTIRAEHISLAPTGRSATITTLRNQGTDLRLTCTAPEPFTILLRDTDASAHSVGDSVNLEICHDKIRVLRD